LGQEHDRTPDHGLGQEYDRTMTENPLFLLSPS
jgi:hypothetical protein